MKKLLLLIFLSATVQFSHSQKTLNIGIISDFDKSDQRNHGLNNLLVDQIQKSVGSSYSVILDQSNSLTSLWDVEQTKLHYQRLTEQCDLILLIGGTSINGALRNETFLKPGRPHFQLNLNLVEPFRTIPYGKIPGEAHMVWKLVR